MCLLWSACVYPVSVWFWVVVQDRREVAVKVIKAQAASSTARAQSALCTGGLPEFSPEAERRPFLVVLGGQVLYCRCCFGSLSASETKYFTNPEGDENEVPTL